MNPYVNKVKMMKQKNTIICLIICGLSATVMIAGYVMDFISQFNLNANIQIGKIMEKTSIIMVVASSIVFMLTLLYYALFRAIANYYIMKLGEENERNN